MIRECDSAPFRNSDERANRAEVAGTLVESAARCLIQGNPGMAEWLCEEALKMAPEHPQALHLLALVLERRGNKSTALSLLLRAIAAEPDFSDAILALGSIHRSEGRVADAVRCHRHLVTLNPADADAWYNFGNAFFDIGNLPAAERAFRIAVRLRPDNSCAWHNLGATLHRRDDAAAALSALLQAAALAPESASVYQHLATLYSDTGNLTEAVTAVERQARLLRRPLDTSLVASLVFKLRDAGRNAEGLRLARIALALNAGDTILLQCAGVLSDRLGNPSASIRYYQNALRYDPASVSLLNSLGIQLVGTGFVQDGLKALGRASRLCPDDPDVLSNILLCRQYVAASTLSEQQSSHRAWFEKIGRRKAPLVLSPRDADPDRRVRLGYVSGDFGRHPVGYFLSGVLSRHDRTNFEVHCYSVRRHSDDLTRKLKETTEFWHHVPGLGADALAERIRDDGIDILVDLSGHTGNNRLLTFVRKPAPIQVTWAGYVGTTGIPTIDYLISDAHQTPAGVDHHYVETIVRLPDCYVCYEPPPYAPEVGAPPVLLGKGLTFGCFNNLAKIDEATVTLWADLLRGRPERRLLLATFALAAPEARKAVQSAFARYGIGPNQLWLEGPLPHPDLLRAYNHIDIALDPLPYSGGLTTLEALWMGVPVVTRPGERFCTRHAASHLNAVGLPSLIAEDNQGYIAAVQALVSDPNRLARMRANLRTHMAASPVCDAAGFTRNLEAAFRGMWQRWCLRRAPSGGMIGPTHT